MFSVDFFFMRFCGAFMALFMAEHSPAGTWKCASKSGFLDQQTSYELLCSGEIGFKNTGILESTCTEAFTPNGALWKIAGDTLVLSDSEDKPFVMYRWKRPDERTLILEKKGIIYTFDRVLKPQTAKH